MRLLTVLSRPLDLFGSHRPAQIELGEKKLTTALPETRGRSYKICHYDDIFSYVAFSNVDNYLF